jgi:ABC transport system ATP-binding/permease protein
MLQPADVLLLDEPTNDLDIPTLEILEESLLEYPGALVLVTHDRFMLDRVSTVVLGLDGMGGAEGFADYAQWEAWQRSRKTRSAPGSGGASRSQAASETGNGIATATAKKKLSYGEARELANMEQRIAEAEQDLHAKRAALADPAVMSDAVRLHRLAIQMSEAQKTVDGLYARWADLEKKGS